MDENISMGDARPVMGESVDEMELSVRTYNCLRRAGIHTLDELCELTPDDLAKVHNMGRKSYDEIIEMLAKLGRRLKSDHDSDKSNSSSDTDDEVQSEIEKIFLKHGMQIFKNSNDAVEIFRREMSPSRELNIIALIFECGKAETLVNDDADMVRYDICKKLNVEYGISKDISEPVVRKMQAAIEKTKLARKKQFGRSICNTLKEMRRQFADANGIEYEEKECMNPNPCTGTCPYCEERNRYLLDQAAKLSAEKDIVYPDFNLSVSANEDNMNADADQHDNDELHMLAGFSLPHDLDLH